MMPISTTASDHGAVCSARRAGWMASAVLGAAILAALPSPATAQVDSSAWRFSVSPYLWGAATGGTIGVGPVSTDFHLSFGDLLDQLDFGFMAVLEARRGRTALRLDSFYASLTDEAAVPLGGTSLGLEVTQKQLMLQPEVSYAAIVRPWGAIDVLAAMRYWHMSADLGASQNGTSVGSQSSSKDWADVVGGARLRLNPGARWHLWASGDLGAGGSDFTWQAIGGTVYDMWSCCSLVAAYRYLKLDYESDAVTSDIHMSGPAVGVQWRF